MQIIWRQKYISCICQIILTYFFKIYIFLTSLNILTKHVDWAIHVTYITWYVICHGNLYHKITKIPLSPALAHDHRSGPPLSLRSLFQILMCVTLGANFYKMCCLIFYILLPQSVYMYVCTCVCVMCILIWCLLMILLTWGGGNTKLYGPKLTSTLPATCVLLGLKFKNGSIGGPGGDHGNMGGAQTH